MSCAALALCGFFLDAGLSAHEHIRSAGTEPVVIDGLSLTEQQYWRYDINETRNPYGVLAIGYEARFSPRLSLSISLRHESSVATNEDHGTNSAELNLRWHPFGT